MDHLVFPFGVETGESQQENAVDGTARSEPIVQDEDPVQDEASDVQIRLPPPQAVNDVAVEILIAHQAEHGSFPLQRAEPASARGGRHGYLARLRSAAAAL